MLKIKGTEIQQALTRVDDVRGRAVRPALRARLAARKAICASVAGPEYAAPLAATYCNFRKVSIYGGSNEIQRNIISQMILGL